MPLPTTELELVAPQASSSLAFLVRVPEHVWDSMGDNASVTVADGLTIDLGTPVIVSSQPHQPVDLYAISTSSGTMTPLATASARLTFPLSSASSTHAADRLKAQNEALERARRQRAEGVTGAPAKPAAVARSASANGLETRAFKPKPRPSALAQSVTAAPAPAVASLRPASAMPLKTRVVQLLALGPIAMPELVARLGAAEGDVARVVNVVGRADGTDYTLLPSQYSKVKLGSWDYTPAERDTVVRLARAAFDELGLPSDADERSDLDRKASEVPTATNGNTPAAAPAAAPAPAPVDEPNGASDSGSASSSSATRHAIPPARSASSASATRRPAPSASSKTDKERTKVGKQIAKFRAEHVKRASSLPRPAKDGATAPERDAPRVVGRDEPGASGKRKREREGDDAAGGRSARRASPIYTSSEDEGEGRGRTRKVKPKAASGGRPESSNGTSRPPANGHAATPTAAASTPSARAGSEAMRERYEELFPAYEQLSARLAGLYDAAEQARAGRAAGGDVGEVGMLAEDELRKLVERWERWHVELEEIRRHFVDG